MKVKNLPPQIWRRLMYLTSSLPQSSRLDKLSTPLVSQNFKWRSREKNPSQCRYRASPRSPHESECVWVSVAKWHASQGPEETGWCKRRAHATTDWCSPTYAILWFYDFTEGATISINSLRPGRTPGFVANSESWSSLFFVNWLLALGRCIA